MALSAGEGDAAAQMDQSHAGTLSPSYVTRLLYEVNTSPEEPGLPVT